MSKILIVEDEESIADLEKDYLELSGFEVEIEIHCRSGENYLWALRWRDWKKEVPVSRVKY